MKIKELQFPLHKDTTSNSKITSTPIHQKSLLDETQVNLQTGPSKTHLKTLMAHNYLRYLQTYSSGSLVNFIFAPSTYPIKVIE